MCYKSYHLDRSPQLEARTAVLLNLVQFLLLILLFCGLGPSRLVSMKSLQATLTGENHSSEE